MANHCALRLVVLVSGNGSNLQAILDSIAAGTLSARVLAVFSDQPAAFGLVRAKQAGVPAVIVEREMYRCADDFYLDLLQRIKPFAPELLVLAGFMRILPGWFIAQLTQPIINIHPSLLPKYKGLNTHQRALDAGEHEHGATVHWVTDELDSGATIIQSSVTIAPDDNAETLRQRVLLQEHQIYPHAIQWFAQNRQTIRQATASGNSPAAP